MSLSTIDQSTGNPTPVAGNVNDKVGNLAALTTTDKSSLVGAVNELKSGLTGVTNVPLTAISFNAGVTVDTGASALYIRGGRLYGSIKFTGFATIGANGTMHIGTISSQYRPIVNSRMPAYINGTNNLVDAVVAVLTNGYIALVGVPGTYGKGDGTGGDSWDTSDGIYFDYPVSFT